VIRVRAVEPTDRPAVDAFLDERSTLLVARLGELVDAREYPTLIAEENWRLAGVLTFIDQGDRWEVLTLHVEERRHGVGSALIRTLESRAREAGCRLLRLITTNDNVDALHFYQRRGFHLAELHPGAVDVSRRALKSEIPTLGEYGIPIRDELELHKEL
jgi:ribosomal protein S18 acetylase RimI-like enzyme